MEVISSLKSSNADLLSMPSLSEMDEEDLYTRHKFLLCQLEFVDIQEEYVKDEQKNLKRDLLRAQEEVKRIQSVPLVIGQFIEMVDQNNGIVGLTTGSNCYVRILSTINRELLKSSSSVALHRHSNALVDVLPSESDSSISLLTQSEKPDVSYMDIGGCDIQKQEIRLGYGVGGEVEAPSQSKMVLVQAAGGVVAGAISSVTTTPMDKIKTRLQVLKGEG